MGKMSQHLIHVFLFFLLINHCVGPPTKHQAPDNSSKSEDNQAGSIVSKNQIVVLSKYHFDILKI